MQQTEENIEGAWLLDVKVGDHVFVGRSQYGKTAAVILPVESKTKTLIRVKYKTGVIGAFRLQQYKWDNSWHAYSHPSTSYGSELIALASPEECVAEQYRLAKEQANKDAKERAEKAAEAKRAELRELFAPDDQTNNVYVKDAEWGDRQGKFDVTFHGLKEEEVRELAAKLAAR